jgi:CHAT domain-containing protein
VLAGLRERVWDVLHYAGHASFVQGEAARSGLKLWHGRLTAGHVKDAEL